MLVPPPLLVLVLVNVLVLGSSSLRSSGIVAASGDSSSNRYLVSWLGAIGGDFIVGSEFVRRICNFGGGALTGRGRGEGGLLAARFWQRLAPL